MRLFKEEQRFTQTWLLVLLGISVTIPLFVLFTDFFQENSTMSLNDLLLSSALIIASIVPIFFLKLITRIDETGIHYQFSPFHLSQRTISWHELISANIRVYDAISEYGGWGLKGGFFWKKNKNYAYNVSGSTGIQLTCKNGTRVLIGTQKPENVKALLATYASKINKNER